jgi:hypothetical protein
MRTPDEVASFVVGQVHDLVDEVLGFIGPVASDDESYDSMLEVDRAVDRMFGPPPRHATRSTWERHTCSNALMAVGAGIREQLGLERDPNEDDPEEDGWDALRDGNLQAAASAAERLLAIATDRPDDERWQAANAHHWGHIILGHVRLRKGDLTGAEEELRAAGEVHGSPQLDSFGPDLFLAWTLLDRGHDAAVLEYFHNVARFWSPRRRRP